MYKQRLSTIIFLSSLLFFIAGYIANNLLWGVKSPIYFYCDSLENMQRAINYGKWFRNEISADHPYLLKESIRRHDLQTYSDNYVHKSTINRKNFFVRYLLRYQYPPAWFMFLGIFFAVFGFKLWVIYLAQAILGAITIWLTYIAAKRTLSAGVGILSALTLSASPFFLFITRECFLEAMVWPTLLIEFILVHNILQYPSKRIYYIFLGIICALSMLIKTSSLIFIVVFLFMIIIIFSFKKIWNTLVIKNIVMSLAITLVIALPYYIYNFQFTSEYICVSFIKDKLGWFTLAPKCKIFLFLMMQYIELGIVVSALFVLGITRFCFRLKSSATYLLIFLVFGYLFLIFSPFMLRARHYAMLLPFVIMLICSAITDLPKLRPYLAVSFAIFSIIRGYGWLAPNLFQQDQMRYLYHDNGADEDTRIEYEIYPKEIRLDNIFSSFSPLPPMQQRAVYEIIKKNTYVSGLKVVEIEQRADHHLEAKTLAASLILYSRFEDFPLTIDINSEEKDVVYEDKIIVSLRNPRENVRWPWPSPKNQTIKVTYMESVPLYSAVVCDIFTLKMNSEN